MIYVYIYFYKSISVCFVHIRFRNCWWLFNMDSMGRNTWMKAAFCLAVVGPQRARTASVVEPRMPSSDPVLWCKSQRSTSWIHLDTSGIFGTLLASFSWSWIPSFCHCNLWTTSSTQPTPTSRWMPALQFSTGLRTSSFPSSPATWRALGVVSPAISAWNVPLRIMSPLKSHTKIPADQLRKVTLIQDNRKIIMRYLRTWFVPDLIVTAIDLVLEPLGML